MKKGIKFRAYPNKEKVNGGFIWSIYDVHIAVEVMEMMIKF